MLALIAAAGILLVCKENGSDAAASGSSYIVNPANAPAPFRIDSTQEPAKPAANTKPATFPQKKKDTRRKPYPAFPKTEKYPEGTIVELNTADTTTLKKIPGIGSSFSRRIVKYRNLLGGFYSVAQLREVYGIDEDFFQSLQKWFHADTTFIAHLPVNHLPADSLARHPYISYRQANTIYKLRKQKGTLAGWQNLQLLEEFTKEDRERLSHYIAF